MTARLCRFSLIGLLGAMVQIAAFDAMVRLLRVPPAAAAIIAVELAILHNFWWHKRFTWRDRAGSLWRFHLANGLVSIAGNAALAWLLVDQLHLPAAPSAVASIAVCAPLNFLMADRWVYRARLGM